MPTPSEEFPCRTKQVSGVTYRVRFFDENGDLRISTSYSDRARAERNIATMKEHAPTLRGEIIEQPWTETVCIECGQEVY